MPIGNVVTQGSPQGSPSGLLLQLLMLAAEYVTFMRGAEMILTPG